MAGTRESENGTTNDSLTFGQLKKIVAQQRARPREAKYAFTYADRDTLQHELEDWHDYAAEDALSSLLDSCGEFARQPWPRLGVTQKKEIIQSDLDCLKGTSESSPSDVESACARLSYISQGCFAQTKGTEHQIHLILDNTALLHDCGALHILVDCFKGCLTQSIESTQDMPRLEECLRHLSTCLYFYLEGSRTKAYVSEELRSLDQSFVAFLLGAISQVSDKQEEGQSTIPISSLVMLLHQTILSTFGGRNEVSTCKKYLRQTAGLPDHEDKLTILTTPIDYSVFRAELISKYPSYTPPPLHNLQEVVEVESKPAPQSTFLELPIFTDGQWTATPAPSPPPSPKGKKSMYTTNQSIPFVLPLNDCLASSIPASIEEAAALFQSRQRTTVPLAQLWKEQENFVKSERGWSTDQLDIDSCPVEEVAPQGPRSILDEVERTYSEVLPHLQSSITSMMSIIWTHANQNIPPTQIVHDKDTEAKIEESLASTRGWLFGDAPQTKTETKDKTSVHKSIREKDNFRAMEIVFKAISGSLILLLKWFRASHVLKFEYLSQILLDADWIHNFHQAIMALNPANNAAIIHDDSRRSYFNVCNSLSMVSDMGTDPDDSDQEGEVKPPNTKPQGPRPRLISSLGDREPSPLTTFSWRLFFSLISMLKITQKLAKKKVHRNSLLVQAKTWLHLRRPLRVPHDEVQLCCLKLYKGQVPLCSRKWRMGNMRVITQIYMSCRPELREDWIAGTEMDTDLDEAKQHEEAIRALILFYNLRKYPEQMAELGYRREEESESDDDFFETEIRRQVRSS